MPARRGDVKEAREAAGPQNNVMFKDCFAQVSGGTALSNSNPMVSKSSREWFLDEVSISGPTCKILNAKRVGHFETMVSPDIS